MVTFGEILCESRKPVSFEEFKKRAENKHGDKKYKYFLSEYKGYTNITRIWCTTCNKFFPQRPKDHANGQNCPKCSRKGPRQTFEQFEEKANKKHENKYNYSLAKEDYIDSLIKVRIICPEHNNFIFKQRPANHVFGQKCPKCSKVYKKNTKEFIDEARKIHGDKFDYSLVNYKGAHKKIKIFCIKHNYIFKQTPANHTNGENSCPKCANNIKKTNNEFINEAREIHGNKYDYFYINYENNRTKIKIICPKHNEFYQSPSKHLIGQGCPFCRESKGEKHINSILEKYKIEFNRQQIFEKCKRKRFLPFDFYLEDYNLCIEFQGEQHYLKQSRYATEAIKESDEIKRNFCKNYHINLLCIKYIIPFEKIEELLKKIFIRLDKDEYICNEVSWNGKKLYFTDFIED